MLQRAGRLLARGFVAQQVVWLMGAPAGLKLHHELSHLYGSASLLWLRWTARAYGTWLVPALPVLVGADMRMCGRTIGRRTDRMMVGQPNPQIPTT
jgi:N-acetylglucosaminyl transferase component (Gpi1)